ncbi:hypothetical protein TRVL_10059 [Trypanosoma vivax]|nr:hypothetical protein TRVL_10059 [Trypanosoma vivax]
MKTALFSGGLQWRQNIADVRYLSCSTRRATYFVTTSICINQQLRDKNNKSNNKTAWWCVGEQMTFFCLAFLLHFTTFCNKVANNNKEINPGKRFHFLKPSRKLFGKARKLHVNYFLSLHANAPRSGNFAHVPSRNSSSSGLLHFTTCTYG